VLFALARSNAGRRVCFYSGWHSELICSDAMERFSVLLSLCVLSPLATSGMQHSPASVFSFLVSLRDQSFGD
jgi:hypothetical protein